MIKQTDGQTDREGWTVPATPTFVKMGHSNNTWQFFDPPPPKKK